MGQLNIEELIELLMDSGSVELTGVQMDIDDLVLDIDGQGADPNGQVNLIQQMMLGISQSIQVPLAHMNALEQMLLGEKKI